MKDWIGIVDCRVDEKLENDFLTLNLWGKSVFEYPLEEVAKCGLGTVIVLANTDFVKESIFTLYGNAVSIMENFDYESYKGKKVLFVSGRAPLVKYSTLKNAINMYRGGGDVNCRCN